MQCCHCNSDNTKRHGKGRYKCNDCGRTFVERINSPFYRYRFKEDEIEYAVIEYIFTQPQDIQVKFHMHHGKYVSEKSIRAWYKKFAGLFCKHQFFLPADKDVTLYTDEKFVKVKGVWAYWWSVRDKLGNIYASIVTELRDLASAKRLFRIAKKILDKFGLVCVRLVTDGCKAYIRAKNILGRRCKHVRTGIQGKLMQFKNTIELVTNNFAESLNAKLDKFLAKYSYSFPTIQAANDAANNFLCLCGLRLSFKAWSKRRNTSMLV